jgi:hypothetical protein
MSEVGVLIQPLQDVKEEASLHVATSTKVERRINTWVSEVVVHQSVMASWVAS